VAPNHAYLDSFRKQILGVRWCGCEGLAFFTKAPAPLDLPPGTEVVEAKKIWMP
jgi:hypothetical protein